MKYPRDFASGTLESPDVRPTCSFGSAGPNPFVTSTAIRYSLPVRSRVVVMVVDASGRVVERLTNCTQDPGSHAVTFAPGRSLASGVYFARLQATPASGGRTQVVTRVLIKEH
jgi:hypothetical protein